ncbi:MAG: hypothetical protein ABSH12_03020 [Endomicrobiales bacterium]
MKTPLRYFICSSLITFVLTATLFGAVSPKNVIIIADWGALAPPPAVLDFLERTPSLKMTIPWSASIAPSEKMKELVRRGQVEPLMTIVDEPLLSSIDESDARDIIARTREWFQGYFPKDSAALYLRSGVYPEELISSLKQWGVAEIVLSNVSAAMPGGYAGYAGSNSVLITGSASGTTTDQYWNQVEASSASVAVIVLHGSSVLNPTFFSALNEKLMLDPSVVATVPSDRTLKKKIGLPAPVPLNNTTPRWMYPPALWQKVSEARTAIEVYKNSGQANVKNMEMARGELYHLYSYDFAHQIQEGTDPVFEQEFTAALHNIYHLIGKPFPAEEPSGANNLVPVPVGSSFAYEVKNNSLTIHNATHDIPKMNIESLTVTVDSTVVGYQVNVTSAAWSSSSIVDIYIDMNNQRGAGLTSFLPGPAAFLYEEDAWELAIRMERYQISLYRCGRREPILMKTFKTSRPYHIDIPRSLLRGNPLAWGYQAVVMARRPVGEQWEIFDFLSSSTVERHHIFSQTPLQLHVIRNRNP